MAAPDSVQFKVALTKAGQLAEIRRFTIEKDVVTNYAYLRQKLYSLFPILQSTGMTVSWKDAEDDLITIGSDEELIIALTEMEGLCKKLFVNVSTPQVARGVSFVTGVGSGIPESIPKTLHEGVSCDGCEGPVVGYRYKCMACPDYDLCFDCEHSGKHSEHVMIRYPHPMSREYHFLKKLKKLHRRFDHHSMYETGPHRGFRWEGRAPRCPAMSDDVGDLVDDFITTLRTQVNVVTPELIQQVIESLSNMDLSGLNVPEQEGAANSSKNQDEKAKGESSKKKGKEERANKKRGCPFAEKRPSNASGDGFRGLPPGTPQLSELISTVMQQVGSVAPQVMPTIMSTLNQFGAAASGSQPPSFAGQSAPTPNAAPTPGPSAPASEPMVVNVEEESSTQAAPSQPEAQAGPQPVTTPPKESSQSSAFDELVDRQLQTMLNMGFNNEGGWLRDLLKSKNGDITQVLDHLSGSNKSSPLSRIELD